MFKQQAAGQGHGNHAGDSTDELTSTLSKWSTCSLSNAWVSLTLIGLVETERGESHKYSAFSKFQDLFSFFFCYAYNSPLLLGWKESTAFDFNIPLPAFLCWLKFRWSKPASWIKARGKKKSFKCKEPIYQEQILTTRRHTSAGGFYSCA